MPDQSAPRDDNRVPVIVAVSSVDEDDLVFIQVNPSTGAIKAETV